MDRQLEQRRPSGQVPVLLVGALINLAGLDLGSEHPMEKAASITQEALRLTGNCSSRIWRLTCRMAMALANLGTVDQKQKPVG